MHTTPEFDAPFPWARVHEGMARAQLAVSAANRAAFEQWAAIDAVLTEARAFPEIFVEDLFSLEPEAVEFAERAAIADLSVRLSLSPQTVRTQAHAAETLIARAPQVWQSFGCGELSAANARVIADLADTLPSSAWAEFEAAVLPLCPLAPARFKEHARVQRERVQPEAASERHRRAAQERRTWLEPSIDGMTWFGAHFTAVQGELAAANIERISRRLLAEPDEKRTLAQIRADVAADLLGGVLGADGGSNVKVGVLVPVMTLLGHSDEPALLDGYGPIDAETARTLTAHAPSFYRVLTHPVSSAILDLDRSTYRVPTDLARLVGLRDRICTAIGCGRQARYCEIDHTVAWADGGGTNFSNLKLLCHPDHRVRHNSRSRSEQDEQGRTTWTTPTGFVRAADPPPF